MLFNKRLKCLNIIYSELSAFAIRIVIAATVIFFLFKKVLLYKESYCHS